MERPRTWFFQLEGLHKRKAVGVFVCFFLGVLLCLGIGLVGPPPYITSQWQQHKLQTGEFSFATVLEGLRPFNAEWWFSMRPEGWSRKSAPPPFDVVVSISGWKDPNTVDCLVNCPEGERAKTHTRLNPGTCQTGGPCSSTTLASLYYLQHENMKFVVEIPANDSLGEDNRESIPDYDSFATQFTYSNYKFWIFELAFRYVFVVMSAIAFALYSWALSWIRDSTIAEEQMAVAVLLMLLIAFNNPLFAADLFVKSWIFPTLNAIFLFSFICFLLFIILVFAHTMLLKDPSRRSRMFWIPKMILMVLFWLGNVLPYIYARKHAGDNPAESVNVLYAHYAQFTLPFLAVYLFWMIYLAFRICGQWSSLNYYSKRWKLLFALTMLVVLFTAICLVFFIYEQYCAAEFLTMFGVFNFYTNILAFLLSPSTHGAYSGPTSGIQRWDEGDYNEIELQEGAWV